MKKIKIELLLLVLGWMGCFYTVQAQQKGRNLLSHFSKNEVADALIPLSEWHPFPQTEKEWTDILPDTIREKIISLAQQYSTMLFSTTVCIVDA